MLSFESDYTEGAHPAILEKFIETNMDQQSGYGVDVYSESARKRLRKHVVKKMLIFTLLQVVHRLTS